MTSAAERNTANLAISFQALAELTGLPLARVDPVKRTFRYVSPAFCELMGLPEEKLLGMVSWDTLAPEQRSTITESSAYFLARYRYNPWVLSVHPDGGRQFRAMFYMTQVTWDDGSLDTLLRVVEIPVTYLSAGSSIIEKPIARPASSRYSPSPVGAWMQALPDQPWVVNEAMHEIFEMPTDEDRADVNFKDFQLERFIHPEDLPELALIIQEGLLTPTIVNVTVRAIRADGAQRIIEIVGQTYVQDGDSPIPTHSVGTVRDISDRVFSQRMAEAVLSFDSSDLSDSLDMTERSVAHLVNQEIVDYAACYLVDPAQELRLIAAAGDKSWIAEPITEMAAVAIDTQQPAYFPIPSSSNGATGLCAPIVIAGEVVALFVIQSTDQLPDVPAFHQLILRISEWLVVFYMAFGLPPGPE